jgi:O-antigen/teichoic acid export membrane protein
MVISLIYTPLLLKYLGDEKYGIWVTMLSILNWIMVFDIGIGNGLRNVLTTKIKQGKKDEAQGAVSSAYYALGAIVFFLLLVSLCVCYLIDWNSVFKSNLNVLPAVIICLTFICINFVASLQKNEYYAIQKSEVNSIFGVVVQIINLLGIVALRYCAVNELVAMSVLTGLSTFAANVFFSFLLWRKNPHFIPYPSKIKRCFIRDVSHIGIKFFAIQISGLVLFTTDNFIISMLYGAEMVTAYSIPMSIFNIINAVFGAVLLPFWSKATEMKEQNNWPWIKRAVKMLNLLLIPFAILIVFVVIFFDGLTTIWIGRVIGYSPYLIATLGIYCFLQLYNAIYSTMFAGIGAVNIQLALSLLSAAVNIPLSIFLAKNCGLGPTGVCLATVLGFAVGAVVFTIQMSFILRKNIHKLSVLT